MRIPAVLEALVSNNHDIPDWLRLPRPVPVTQETEQHCPPGSRLERRDEATNGQHEVEA